ncbi:retrotransposon protein, putative, unclassified [Tanacetum coccineum]
MYALEVLADNDSDEECLEEEELGECCFPCSECKQFHWKLQGVDFWSDVMLLPLGGCEMVLGQNAQDSQPEYSSMQLCVFPGPEISLMRLEGIPTKVKPELQSVIQEFEEVFSVPTVLPPNRPCDHKIPLLERTNPVNVRPYRHHPTQKDAIEGTIQELLATGVIRSRNSLFASPIVMVKKKDNTWRMCVDYKQLNKQTIKDKFPIPIIEELIDKLHGSQVFTKLNLRSGYHQIRMYDDDVAKTAFKTHHGHYEFLVMPFGLTNAPSTFQALMNEVFKSFLRKIVLVFFDDILIYSKSLEERVIHLRTVLEEMKRRRLYVKLSKCVFGTRQVEYLGHVISVEGVSTGPTKIKAMEEWQVLSNVKQLRGFLSLTGYYRRFIKAYASISRPLTLLLKKNSFQWNEEAQIVFENLKKAMISAIVLALTDLEKEFTVETDASGVGIGAVLIQGGHPIAYLSKTLSAKHQLMSTYEKEFLAVKGIENVSADALSRIHNEAQLLSLFTSSPVTTELLKKTEATWEEDNELKAKVDQLKKGETVAQAFLDNIYKLHGMPGSIVFDKDKVFISTFWKELFKLLHVKLLMSTAYHLQTDGQTEVVNRGLECYLRCMCGETPKDWIKWLSLAEWCGESRVDTVDRTLTATEEVIKALTFHLKRAQERMKTQADKHRSKREFAIGDWVYLKMQPHRQLKRCKGQNLEVGILPQCDNNGLIQAQPVAILERKLRKVENVAAVFVLVQWANSGPEDAT